MAKMIVMWEGIVHTKSRSELDHEHYIARWIVPSHRHTARVRQANENITINEVRYQEDQLIRWLLFHLVHIFGTCIVAPTMMIKYNLGMLFKVCEVSNRWIYNPRDVKDSPSPSIDLVADTCLLMEFRNHIPVQVMFQSSCQISTLLLLRTTY